MATVKAKLRPSTVEGRPGTVVYLVTHRRRVRQIAAGYRLLPAEWDEMQSLPAGRQEGEPTSRIGTIRQAIGRDTGRLRRIIGELAARREEFTADEVIRRFHMSKKGMSFFGFMEDIIRRLRQWGRERTAENYATALASFRRFRGGADLAPDELDTTLAGEYEAHLLGRGVAKNTVSFYNRILRAVYNRAVEQGLTAQRHPFRRVYTGIDRTAKRALPLDCLRRIKELDLAQRPSQDFARDMFLFSFYTRGMSFVDMAFLQQSDLRGDILSYRRRKTGQQLCIKWERPMQEIVDKYASGADGYLLPIVRRCGNERRQYRNAIRRVNNRLKDIAAAVGLPGGLSMYAARHSWASIARSQNIPLSVISAGMGHDSENTTQIYLASLDNSEVEKANDLILRKLK